MIGSKLNPFDAELLVMIGDIAKSQPEGEENPDHYEITVDTTEIQGNAIEALKQAVAGRLEKRLLVTHTLDAAVVFNVEYDPTEYPEQIRTRLVEPDATAGTRYCRTLLEVDAIQVRRDNLDDLLRFTGGGTMTIPRTPNGRAVYSFPDGNGIFIDAPETYYIVREPDGRLTTRPEREFNREFEPKGVSVPKEPGDKGCGNCANFTNEDVNGNGYCEAFKCEQSCGVMRAKSTNPKINKAMNKREKFLKEIAEVINRNSLEAHFNDTPDYILAEVAAEAMENFAEASARRDNWHGFKEADKPGEVVRNEDCDNCPVRGICPEHKKPEAFDVPKEVRAMAEFFGKMFPGSKVEIHRVEMPKRNPRDKRRAKNKRKGATMGKSNCPGQSKPEKDMRNVSIF